MIEASMMTHFQQYDLFILFVFCDSKDTTPKEGWPVNIQACF
jgi:hypothetical protein